MMTAAEQVLADDKMRAEIGHLMASTAKLNAETAKISRERYWIPFTVFAGVIVAVLTIIPRIFGI